MSKIVRSTKNVRQIRQQELSDLELDVWHINSGIIKALDGGLSRNGGLSTNGRLSRNGGLSRR